MRRIKGYSLLELLIVVGVALLVISIALPHIKHFLDLTSEILKKNDAIIKNVSDGIPQMLELSNYTS